MFYYIYENHKTLGIVSVEKKGKEKRDLNVSEKSI